MGEPAIGPIFRREVEAFISVKGISESRFGTEAAGDASFVKRLRNGTSFRLATVDRVRTWMRNAMRRAERAAVSRLIKSAPQADPSGSSPSEHPPEYHREVFLSAHQAAAFLTLSSDTLLRFRETGGGPAYCEFGNIGSCIRAPTSWYGRGKCAKTLSRPSDRPVVMPELRQVILATCLPRLRPTAGEARWSETAANVACLSTWRN